MCRGETRSKHTRQPMPQRRCALRMQSVGEFEQLRAAAQPLAKRCDRLGIVVASSNRILAAFHAFTMCFAAASHRRRSQRSKSRAQSTCRPRDLGHRTAFTAASSTAFGAGTRRSADCSARSADCSHVLTDGPLDVTAGLAFQRQALPHGCVDANCEPDRERVLRYETSGISSAAENGK